MNALSRWWRKVRRRRPGIYAYRCRQHKRPWRREWGYVGLSNRLDRRDGQHVTKPWYDLVVSRRTLRLPWWLGWRWILAPLETLAILLLLPRYNWQKNPRPTKIGPRGQELQRMLRDTRPSAYVAATERVRLADLFFRTVGILMIVVGIGGALWASR